MKFQFGIGYFTVICQNVEGTMGWNKYYVDFMWPTPIKSHVSKRMEISLGVVILFISLCVEDGGGGGSVEGEGLQYLLILN